MHYRTPRLALVAAFAALFASTAGAQSLAVYGAAEAAGFGEGDAILGATLTPGVIGWNWLVGANVQTYRFRNGFFNPDGSFHKEQRVAFNPYVGAQYRTTVGSVEGSVGYNFVSGDVTSTGVVNGAPLGVGAPGGGQNSPVLAAQANYWGGIMEHSAIVSYATTSEYIWSRLRLAARPVPTAPVYLGGEFIAQGGSDFGYRYQVGPTLNVHITPNFHAGINGGIRWNSYPSTTTTSGGITTTTGGGTGPKSGYVGVSFLALSAF